MTKMEAVTNAIHGCRARALVVMVVMIHQTNGSRPRFHQDAARGPTRHTGLLKTTHPLYAALGALLPMSGATGCSPTAARYRRRSSAQSAQGRSPHRSGSV